MVFLQFQGRDVALGRSYGIGGFRSNLADGGTVDSSRLLTFGFGGLKIARRRDCNRRSAPLARGPENGR
jgi:hypothetical protein